MKNRKSTVKRGTFFTFYTNVQEELGSWEVASAARRKAKGQRSKDKGGGHNGRGYLVFRTRYFEAVAITIAPSSRSWPCWMRVSLKRSILCLWERFSRRKIPLCDLFCRQIISSKSLSVVIMILPSDNAHSRISSSDIIGFLSTTLATS